ncbi:MAG: zinc-dependent alcohol dehydrogenase family protein [Steroidobacteraceae bacterium]
MKFGRSTLIALCALCAGVLSLTAAAQAPTRTNREVVVEKAATGYRWKLIVAAVPEVGPHEVLVRVHAAALNHDDLNLLAPDPRHDHSGHIIGSDAAGEIVAVGASVTGLHRGERVTNTYFADWTEGPFSSKSLAGMFGSTLNGLFRDYIALPETAVIPIPDGLSYEEAATLPTAALTAWSAVTTGRQLRRGDVVVVQGTGGVSVFALQFAAAMGARVIVTSSSESKLQRALALGASDGIDYRSVPRWAGRVRDLTHSHGADLVVDVGGKATLEQSVQCLADAGTLAVVGGLTGYDGVIPAAGLLAKDARAQAVYVGSRSDFQRMDDFIVSHHLHPVIDRVFPLENYEEALKYLQSGSFVGKIVLRMP